MPLTTKDVLALRDKVLADAKARKDTLTPLEVVQGVRTLVHAQLQEEQPYPHCLPDAEPGKTDADFHQAAQALVESRKPRAEVAEGLQALHVEHIMYRAARVAKAKAGVSVADHAAFITERPYGVTDAHHYVQRRHGMKLWEEADALVAAAGVK